MATSAVVVAVVIVVVIVIVVVVVVFPLVFTHGKELIVDHVQGVVLHKQRQFIGHFEDVSLAHVFSDHPRTADRVIWGSKIRSKKVVLVI